jgi:hypothetical protein
MGIVNPSVAPADMLTLADYYQRIDQGGNILDIAEALNESNEVMQDLVFKEGNLTNGDQQSIRTGLPQVYWKQFNRGVPSSKSSVATVQEQCGQMEARADVDVDLIEMNGTANAAAVRRQEDKAFLESMGQMATHTIFKGDYKKKSEGFSGFETRYSDMSAVNGKNIIDAGGTGNSLTSIWLVGWGDNVYCPYPKGSKLGLRTEDKGKVFVPDDQGNEYEVYRTMYKMNLGLMVKDWRYVVRIANIDTNALKSNQGIGNPDLKTQGYNLITMMLDALTKLPTDAKANFKFYMNRDVFAGLNALSLRSDVNVIEWSKATDAFGKGGSWANFQGVPMRRVDQLTCTEKKVS